MSNAENNLIIEHQFLQAVVRDQDKRIAELEAEVKQQRAQIVAGIYDAASVGITLIKSEELALLAGEVREWLCDQCNTVYPGPPQPGIWCVRCPKCEGDTAPKNVIERRRAEREAEKLKIQLDETLAEAMRQGAEMRERIARLEEFAKHVESNGPTHLSILAAKALLEPK